MDDLQRIDQYRWRVPRSGPMLSEGVIYAHAGMVAGGGMSGVVEQLKGVAALPGIVGPALAMPDAHLGYGFPIGGVAAFDPEQGVVSPGGVGYDINCGVRLMRSKLAAADLGPKRLAGLADALAGRVPAGVGVGGGVRLAGRDLDSVLVKGAAWLVDRGLGTPADIELCESGGALPGADPGALSQRARNRGLGQLGTLGAGNHFIELGVVDEVFDRRAASAFGLEPGGLVVWIHSGSRGLGHQVCDDFLRALGSDPQALHPKERQLAAARAGTPLFAAYVGAMAAASNYAFGNRQALAHQVREVMQENLELGPADLGLGLVYDVAHNVAKLEHHQVGGESRRLWVHRKGATRALGPGRPELPAQYRPVGQPVLVPGDMGRFSYVLCGTAKAEQQTFASCAHGAGRQMSRSQAKRQAKGRALDEELARQGILVRARSRATLAEEMPAAYKDVSLVAEVMHGAGIATMVARTRPLVVIKG